jgi:hypothetical protein
MGTIFILAGLFLILKPESANLGPEFAPYTNWIGAIVILYGSFRLYRSILLFRSKKN